MEDKGLVWSTDKDGNWFVGHPEDILDPNDLSEEEKKKSVMLDFRDHKRIAYNGAMFPQISHKPLKGHSRWKVWLTYLLLIMLLLLVWLVVQTQIFNQTANAGILDVMSMRVKLAAERVSQLYEKTKSNFRQHDKIVSSSSQLKQEKLRRKTRESANKRLGKGGFTSSDQNKTKPRPEVTKAFANYLAHGKRGTLISVKQWEPLMVRIKRSVRDPEKRDRAMKAVIAGAVVLNDSQESEDALKYKAIRFGLQNTYVLVNYRPKSVASVLSETILAQAPYLIGTKIAGDPVSVFTYGIVSMGNNDLMNNFPMIPDGLGGLRTVNQAVREVENASQGLETLRVVTCLEGMALMARQKGHLGVYGETFVASYLNLNEVLYGRRKRKD
jgi:hypothetical protein